MGADKEDDGDENSGRPFREDIEATGQDPSSDGELPSLRARIDRHLAEYRKGHITQGRTPGPDDINLANNDYLGLANDRRIIDAQIAALEQGDSEIFMSGVYTQFLDQQRAFEQSLAAFVGTEEAVLCQSGFAANDGLIQSLADETTPVYIDLMAHLSLWQGAHSAGATAYPFRHNDADNLRSLIGEHGPGIVAVDTITGTTGSLCRLAEFADVCDETGSLLVAHESYAMGVRGPEGNGLVTELGLAHRIPYRTFSLSQAFVGRAGAVAGPSRVMHFFRFDARPAIFSSAVLPFEIARFRKTMEIVVQEAWRRDRLAANARRLRSALTELGYNVGDEDSHIIALEAGPEENTFRLRAALEENGVFGSVFCAPATPKNRSLVRFSINSSLSEPQMERIIAVCDRIRDQVRLDQWPSTRRFTVR